MLEIFSFTLVPLRSGSLIGEYVWWDPLGIPLPQKLFVKVIIEATGFNALVTYSKMLASVI